jgi:signal transduction histidine kinase
MITNIVGNAFKYLDSERERKVLVKMMSSDAKIILEIEDTGRGIAPDDLEKVFERFYRGKLFAGGSESGSPSGTGLGLAIAKKIAESHGGSIEIFSQVDQGTTVTIFLNLYRPPCRPLSLSLYLN